MISYETTVHYIASQWGALGLSSIVPHIILNIRSFKDCVDFIDGDDIRISRGLFAIIALLWIFSFLASSSIGGDTS